MALLPFKDYSSILISGATSSGKTQWTYRLLQNLDIFETKPDAILYCYGVCQSLYNDIETIPNVELHKGLPYNLDDWCPEAKHRLIIIDDLMDKVVNDMDMSLLFTQGCHHKHISTIYIMQNLFLQGKYARTISLNTQYIILFRSLRDASQITTLGRQLFPGKSKLLTQVYTEVMKKPYAYLVIDNSPHGHPEYRLRTHIFPGEYPLIYLPNL
jgi:hypothetical protein